ncbi:NAD(P)/FAD-dependent oxidoreductase [Pseudoalteromonas arctica]|uniref:FAD-dependent oxidoreductase n=1 Tax=Pseudoalteromonas arctica TaxID=394751 RepID=A0A7Y0HBL2_9GAMM|nr:FAD-binding oxidoreductase [Pseudoalteromonas arctica]NMM39982.1 FAD-dependent oxidoreductase [Pseudoalteromonas arctica]
MSLKEGINFWHENGEKYIPEPSLRENINADFLVIGGGFSGLSTAFNLKLQSPEAKVVLLESEFIGFGASGRNTGFCVAKFGLDMPTIKMLYGRERAIEAHHFSEQALDYIHYMVKKYNMQSEFRACGFLQVACSDSRRKKLLSTIETYEAMGLNGGNWLEQSKVQENIHSSLFKGGLFHEKSALLHPLKHIREWKRLCLQQGVDIYEFSPVQHICHQSQVITNTPYGQVQSKKLVIATNAYMHLIKGLEGHQRKQTPLWAYIIATEPLSDEQWQAIGWQNREGLQDNRNFLHAIRPSEDGRLIMTGNMPGLSFGQMMNRDNNPKVWQALKDNLAAFFPVLKQLKVTYAWGGAISVTMDMAPSIGYLGDERILYSTGCFGHGVASSQFNGRLLSELALEKETALTNFWIVNRQPLAWPFEPLRYLMKKSIVKFMSLEDRLKENRIR